jgi:hypothetical protein
VGEKIALSRRVEKHWRLIGWGEIRKGSKIAVETNIAAPGAGVVCGAEEAEKQDESDSDGDDN